jgi:hypothetical protein
MKAYWGSGGMAPYFFTSALNAGEWSASRPGRSIPRERDPGTHGLGCWMSPRASLGAVVKKKKFPAPTGIQIRDHPTRSPALYCWAIPARFVDLYTL